MVETTGANAVANPDAGTSELTMSYHESGDAAAQERTWYRDTIVFSANDGGREIVDNPGGAADGMDRTLTDALASSATGVNVTLSNVWSVTLTVTVVAPEVVSGR